VRTSTGISGFLLLVALALGPTGCQDLVWILPEDGSVQRGPFNVQVYWSPDMVPSTLRVEMNDQDITGSMSPASMAPSSDVEIAGVLAVLMNPFPGRKLLTAQMSDSYGLPYGATSIFTATSTAARQGFSGGSMVFECVGSFLNSPIQMPGLDLDLGLSEALCNALPISGVFPSGGSSFPVGSGDLPILFGVFPKDVTFDVDRAVPNGISLSPIEMGLSFDFNPENPAHEGRLCRASFVMQGTVLPIQTAIADQYHAAMFQSLREVSLAVVSAGECESRFTSPAHMDIMTFNYMARK
jgi:hypothetical protein